MSQNPSIYTLCLAHSVTHVLAGAGTSTQKIVVPLASSGDGGRGVARFSFDQICGQQGVTAFGPGDYLAIGANYRAVFIDGLPKLGATQANDARRLISAIDAFYEHQTVAVVLAEVEPEQIFDSGRGADEEKERRRLEKLGDLLESGKYIQQGDDETFAFDRCSSRLREMQSEAYQAAGSGRSLVASDGAGFLLAFEGQALDEGGAAEIWARYAAGADELNQTQMKTLVGDLCMVREGHRKVDPEVANAAWDRVKKWPLYGRDTDTRIDWDRFKAWILMEGMVVEGILDVPLSRRQHKTRLSDKTTFLVYQGAEGSDYTSY